MTLTATKRSGYSYDVYEFPPSVVRDLWIAVVYRGGIIFDTHEADSESAAVAWATAEHSGAERLEARA